MLGSTNSAYCVLGSIPVIHAQLSRCIYIFNVSYSIFVCIVTLNFDSRFIGVEAAYI